MKVRGSLAAICISLCVVLCVSASVWAAPGRTNPGTNITTSPVSSDLHVAPGKTITTTLSIQNNAPQPVAVQLQLQTFKPYGTNGRAQIVPPRPGADYIKWVHFSKTDFVAQPGIWERVQMTISPPPTAALDYYYAVLVKPAVSSPISKRLTTTLKGYNAILILLDVTSGDAKPQLKVSNFGSSHGLYEYLPATFTVTAHNTGNVFLAPAGDIYISRGSNFRSTIDTLPINPSGGNIIPGSARVFSSQWSNGFPLFAPKTIGGQPVNDNSGNPIEQLTWDFTQANKFRFGRYYAKMVFVYNNGQRDVPIAAVVSFWVIPWKLGSFVLLVVALLVFGAYSVGRKIAAKTAHITKKARGGKG